MSKALTKVSDITVEQKEMLRNTICRGASDQEMTLFLEMCVRSKLDPFLRDIYFFKGSDGRPVIGIGIMGYRKRAERTGKYAPGKAVSFTTDKEGSPISATAYVKKQTRDGTWHETSFTVYAKEFPGALRSKMPFHKLGINAESHALRQAFPDEYDGIYAKEELETSILANDIINADEIIVDKIAEFVQKWAEKYPESTIKEFLEARSTHFKKSLSTMIDEMDDEVFKEEIDGWIAKHNK